MLREVDGHQVCRSLPTFMVQFTWICAQNTQHARNGPLETQSSSALQWMVRYPLSWCGSPGIHAPNTERGNGESGHHREEAPSSETGEQRDHETQRQADFNFKEGEVHASAQRKDPSAEGAGTFWDRDR